MRSLEDQVMVCWDVLYASLGTWERYTKWDAQIHSGIIIQAKQTVNPDDQHAQCQQMLWGQ
jgi:hypothetical protein